MNSSPTSAAASASVLQELYLGRVRWDLLQPFPEQDPADRRHGDEALTLLTALIGEQVRPESVESDGLSPETIAALRESGLLAMLVDPALGGLGLSAANASRVIEAAAAHAMPLAFTLAITNGFGVGSRLPALPPGPLRDFVAGQTAAGVLSGIADTEPAGAANVHRDTVAVPVEDGAAYLLTGEKLFIGNGPVADVVSVSATLTGTESVELFVVETDSPGFTVVLTHEFMGLRGAAIGMLRLDRVRVPAHRLIRTSSDGWRMLPDTSDAGAAVADPGRLALLGRHLLIGPTSLAAARMSLTWVQDFVARRSIDGRALGTYEEIQRSAAEIAAEVFAIESILLWCLVDEPRADTRPDMVAAKNLMSRASWRAVDRMVSVLGAEGYETARSKAARGAPAVPAERCFRDTRGLLVAGGVDFMLDRWSGETNLRAWYGSGSCDTPEPPDSATLTPRNREHLRYLCTASASLAERCRDLTTAMPMAVLFERQRTVGLVGRIAGELLGITTVLARSAGADSDAAALADLACTAATHRLQALWSQLDAESAAATALHARIGAAVLAHDLWSNR